MPFFSIVIPSYNNKAYLAGCLDSILSQDFEDWEALVVDDGSPDSSSDIVDMYSSRDSRVISIVKSQNEGTHRARMTGVEQAKGEYIFFLDADDELGECALSELCGILNGCVGSIDMVHCGIEVINAGVDKAERDSFEAYINQDIEELRDSNIIESIFSDKGGYRQDWRVTQRLYRADFLKEAFTSMTKDRLGRAQDCYEFFVIASLAKRQITRNDVIGLKYYYGRGLNGSSKLDLEGFLSSAKAFWSSIEAMALYCSEFNEFDLSESFLGAKSKMMQLLWNDWFVRVPDDEKIKAAEMASAAVGKPEAATQLYRLSRDVLYPISLGGKTEALEPAIAWLNFADELVPPYELRREGVEYREAARAHYSDAMNAIKKGGWYAQPIKIFASAHKPVDLFESQIIQPVQVGCALRNDLFPWAWHDNDGVNISNQNAMYCELTAQYWAWKNVDAEYYGFCHYRRYFNFSSNRYEENEWGEIMEPFIGADSQKKYGLDDETIAKALAGYDLITTEVKDLRGFPGEANTPLEQYEAAPKLNSDDLFHVFAILEDMHPEYSEDIKNFANGNRSCFCNMFIMKKDLFFAYCEWLFPVLDRFVSEWDHSLCSKECLRTPGHLAERLLNIYLMHGERTGASWKRKQVQCVHIEYPDKRYFDMPPVPNYASIDKPVVPVVFAADNNYVPMLTTTIDSMLANASKDYFYDIVVIEDGITGENKEQMAQYFSRYSDVLSVRFFGAGALISGYDLTTSNEHISKETYYRFLIQDILPYYGKVLYLDSDLIIEGDVSELFELNLGDNLLAAAHDVDYMGNLNMHDGKRMEYTKEVLHMDNPFGYFQAGVLVLNTAEMRKLHSVEEWLEIASNPDYIYNDQDILNAHCQGRVKYLGYEWNVMHDCGGRVSNVFSFAPASAFDAYNTSRSSPKIIHYAGFEKPWIMPECDFAEHYWKYARKTPFYEKLIAQISKHKTDELHALLEEEARPPKAVGENNPIRKVVDPIMPLGSRRREAAKAVGRKLRGL